ncbi:MAG: ATP-binding protein [Deltaproteobacteria bacterium]|jgi:hypothetical protein|nr:ATP-binding protein [Deltaproteobacteria bacterium]
MALRNITPEETNRLCCLVYGRPGVGKTSLLRTLPEGARCCVASAESGLLSVNDLVESEAVTGVVIDTFDDFLELYDCLANHEAWKEAYDWVFVDSLSEIASQCVEKFLGKNPSNTIKAWGDYDTAMTRAIKGFRDLTDYHVVFTALDTVPAEAGRTPMVDVPGQKFSGRVTSYFNNVFYMAVEIEDGPRPKPKPKPLAKAGVGQERPAEEEPEPAVGRGGLRRVLLTDFTLVAHGKNRGGVLLPKEPPDLAAIMAKITQRKEQK